MKALKSIQKIVLVAVFIFGATSQAIAQTVLPEIVITASNYKYLNAVSPEESPAPVNMLEQYAAAYDVRGSQFYEDEYDQYFVSFYIPDGKILAAYDKDGKLLRTAEKYKDYGVPLMVKQSVEKKYPQWTISKDVFLVNYYAAGGGVTRKLYKLVLENGDKRMRIKISDTGEFL
jgi:hypothetical protein